MKFLILKSLFSLLRLISSRVASGSSRSRKARRSRDGSTAEVPVVSQPIVYLKSNLLPPPDPDYQGNVPGGIEISVQSYI